MKVSLDLVWLLYPLVAFVTYWPCLNGEPIFDDQSILPHVQTKHSQFGQGWHWRKFFQHRPWTGMSFSLQAGWPNTMRGLHVFNVVVHAGCGLIVQGMARETGLETPFDTLAGLVFIVHPFAVNSVSYVAARGALISCFLGLGSAWALLAGHPFMAVWLWLASLGGKEDAVGFGPLLVGLFLVRGDVFSALLLAGFGLAGALLFRRKLLQYARATGDEVMGQIGLPVASSQPWHAFTVLIETLNRLPLWFGGLGQSPYHGSGMGVPRVFRFLMAWFIALALGFALIFWPVPFLLILLGPWLVYLACPVPDQLMDYRNYSMTAGFALLIAVFLSSAPAWAWVVLVALFGTLTAWSTLHWKTPIAFWLAATFSNSGDPSRAFGELGAYYKLKGDHHTSRLYLEEAIRLNPRFAPALNNLADLCALENDLPRAIELMEACTVRCPQYALGWQDLGRFYERVQRVEDAEQCYRKALRVDRRMEASVNRLGVLAFYRKQFDEALIWFHRALTQRPDHFEYVYNRAVVLKHAGHPQAGAEFDRLPKPCPITPNMIPVEFAR